MKRWILCTTEQIRRMMLFLLFRYACQFLISMLEDEVDLSSFSQHRVNTEVDGQTVPNRIAKLLIQLRVGIRKPVESIVKVRHVSASCHRDVQISGHAIQISELANGNATVYPSTEGVVRCASEHGLQVRVGWSRNGLFISRSLSSIQEARRKCAE